MVKVPRDKRYYSRSRPYGPRTLSNIRKRRRAALARATLSTGYGVRMQRRKIAFRALRSSVKYRQLTKMALVNKLEKKLGRDLRKEIMSYL